MLWWCRVCLGAKTRLGFGGMRSSSPRVPRRPAAALVIGTKKYRTTDLAMRLHLFLSLIPLCLISHPQSLVQSLRYLPASSLYGLHLYIVRTILPLCGRFAPPSGAVMARRVRRPMRDGSAVPSITAPAPPPRRIVSWLLRPPGSGQSQGCSKARVGGILTHHRAGPSFYLTFGTR